MHHAGLKAFYDGIGKITGTSPLHWAVKEVVS